MRCVNCCVGINTVLFGRSWDQIYLDFIRYLIRDDLCGAGLRYV